MSNGKRAEFVLFNRALNELVLMFRKNIFKGRFIESVLIYLGIYVGIFNAALCILFDYSAHVGHLHNAEEIWCYDPHGRVNRHRGFYINEVCFLKEPR